MLEILHLAILQSLKKTNTKIILREVKKKKFAIPLCSYTGAIFGQ